MSWPEVSFLSVCDIQGGTQPPKSEFIENWKEGYVRLLQIQDFKRDDKEYFIPETSKLKKCKDDDVLIARYGASLGKILTGKSGAYNVAIVKTLPDLDKLDKKYLYHYLLSPHFQNFIAKVGGRAAQAGFNKENLSRLMIRLPPLKVQKRIAAILDKTDEINNSSMSAVNLRNNLIVSTFLEMFGDPVINPKQWKIVSMEDVTEKIGSGATPRGGKSSYVQDGISLIRSMNIHDGRFVAKDLAKITDEQANLLSNVIVNEKDVLLNITGASVCRCAIVPSQILPARVNQHVCILRPKTTIIKSEYLLHCLISTNYKEMLLQLSGGGGATREALTKEQIKHLQIPIPPIEIQNKFARFIQSVNDLTKSVNQKIQSNNNLCNSAAQLMNP